MARATKDNIRYIEPEAQKPGDRELGQALAAYEKLLRAEAAAEANPENRLLRTAKNQAFTASDNARLAYLNACNN